MPISRSIPAIFVVAMLPVLLPAPAASAPEATDAAATAPRPEPRPDRALVYYIRTGRYGGSAGSIYLFADKSFVGVLPNGTYGYAYLKPGHRLFWTTWTKASREIDLVPGETYYFDIWRDIISVDAARGEALIQKVRDLAVPDADETKKAAEYIAKKYDKAVAREGEKDRPAEPEVAVAVLTEEERAARVHVPAYTQGLLEFMETVTSEFTPAGTEVRFRVMRDVFVDGRLVVRGGTIIKGVVRVSSQAGAYGKGGAIEISVAALTADDGTMVPLIAQMAGEGQEMQGATMTAGFLGGLIGGSMVQGREAYYLAGQVLKVYTRVDAWVPPLQTAPAVDAAAPGAGSPEPGPEDAAAAAEPAAAPIALAGRGPDLVRFKPKKGYRPDPVTIVIPSDTPPTEVAVAAVGDYTLPAPVASGAPVRRPDGWHCTFDGWEFVRHLRIGHSNDPLPVTLAGRLSDGRAFTSTVPIRYLVEE
ncbi:MAG TPA: hypothetical protein VJV75_01675 [Candidatus Polarisedimenticolia bacterium]|nr:hypothetical protein [Candidatus Polarisedimenticolia bacterium]